MISNVKRPNRVATRPGREVDSQGRIRRDCNATCRPFVVVVYLWDRCNTYGKYATSASADAEVAKLKKLQFDAKRVVRG
jgi:hypothetical protein